MIGAGSKDIKMPSGALGKEAVPIYLLDNSFKTLLISAGTTVEVSCGGQWHLTTTIQFLQ